MNKHSSVQSLQVFEALVMELSQSQPNRKQIAASCEALGLPQNLDLTDLMQVLLEKYPDFLSQKKKSNKNKEKTIST